MCLLIIAGSPPHEASSSGSPWLEAGLPRDLPERVHRLTELGLPGGVEDLSWLGGNLLHLEVGGLGPEVPIAFPARLRSFGSRGGVDLRHLERLPSRTTVLHLPNARLRARPALPQKLTELKIAGLESLAALPRSVQRLSVRGARVDDLWRLPRVEVLELTGLQVRGLEGMPPSVRSLTLRRTAVDNLRHLPEGLEHLVLERNEELDPIDPTRLPRYLISLTLDGQVIASPPAQALPDAAERGPGGWPRYLRALRLRAVRYPGNSPPLPFSLSELEADARILGDLRTLPPDLTSLHIRGGEAIDVLALPSSLRRLTIQNGVGLRLHTLSAFPGKLTVLRLIDVAGEDPWKAPAGVLELDLSGSSIDMPELPRGLVALTLQRSQLAGLPALPASLRRLDLAGSSRLRSLAGLADLPSLEELRIRGTDIRTTVGLPPTLQVLDIAGTEISRLDSLPEGLQELRISQSQFETLEGLPESVYRLVIDDHRGSPPADGPPN